MENGPFEDVFPIENGDIPAIAMLVSRKVTASFLFVTQKNTDTDDLFQDLLAVGPWLHLMQAVKPGGMVGFFRLAFGARYPFAFEKFCSWWTSTDIYIYIYICIYGMFVSIYIVLMIYIYMCVFYSLRGVVIILMFVAQKFLWTNMMII